MHIRKNVSLKSMNTFGLEAEAHTYVEVNTVEELQEALALDIAKEKEILILGGGSNVLLTENVDGLVIKNSILGKEVVEETESHVIIEVGAGENWHELVQYAIENDWGGIENLSLIPGTVGAAPMQNIGAYGVEIKDTFDSLMALHIERNEVEEFSKPACHFGYRESIFKNKVKGQYIITSVRLKLTKEKHVINTSYGAISEVLKEMNIEDPTIKDVSKAVINIRQSKLPDPAEIGNAGSFFKNPSIDRIQHEELKTEYPEIPGYKLNDDQIKIPAAWLIEQCGWKGKTVGNIGVHKNQALVLVNYGGGEGKDLKKLAEDIKSSVIEKFGIELNTEVNIL